MPAAPYPAVTGLSRWLGNCCAGHLEIANNIKRRGMGGDRFVGLQDDIQKTGGLAVELYIARSECRALYVRCSTVTSTDSLYHRTTVSNFVLCYVCRL
jgi:hypothetical protein